MPTKRYRQIGPVMAALAGSAYVQGCSHPLPLTPEVVVRVGGVLATLAIGVGVLTGDGVQYGRTLRIGYWLVLAAQLWMLVLGWGVLYAILHLHRTALAWLTAVVGLHLALISTLWQSYRLAVLSVAVQACGVAGLVLAGEHSSSVLIVTLSGVIPGLLILLGGLIEVLVPRRRKVSAPPPRPATMSNSS